MSRKRKSRSIPATPEGIKLLERAKANARDDEGKPLTYERIAEKAGVSNKTVQRFFNGTSVDRSYAIAIINALDLEKEDVLPLEESLVAGSIEQIQAKDTADSERASELIEGLEKALSELKNSEKASKIAMEWLKANRKSLAKEAAEAALRKHYDQNPRIVDADYSEDIELFAQEIRKYLRFLYSWLKVGSWEFIDRAMTESFIPKNRDSQLYVEALKFIKNKKVSVSLSPEEAKELTLCLNYLISIIPLRF